jgi:hypothetical protein
MQNLQISQVHPSYIDTQEAKDLVEGSIALGKLQSQEVLAPELGVASIYEVHQIPYQTHHLTHNLHRFSIHSYLNNTVY